MAGTHRLRRVNATFGGTSLSSEGIAGLQINGTTVTDEVQTFRAASPKFYYLGNDSVSVSFSVLREFASLKLLEDFVQTHFSDVPKEGDLVLVSGSIGDTVDAVLTSVSHSEPDGLSVTTTYNFRGPPFA